LVDFSRNILSGKIYSPNCTLYRYPCGQTKN
jgi:hypothetical protein